ncbi:adhesion G-protein coupled receptor F3-like isoform X1, partial [Silurus asotus]
RSGSLKGDFVMVINGPFMMSTLVDQTKELQTWLDISFNLTTTGFVKISVPDLVGYYSIAEITCTTPENLENVNWNLQRDATTQTITNGTEAVIYKYSLYSTVLVNRTSEVWKGKFTCDFTSNAFSNIIHRASAYLDVALLPEIFIISKPQFPHCIQNSQVSVTIQCMIANSTEPYNVTWSADDSTVVIPQSSFKVTGMTTIYGITTMINCATEVSVFTCTFTNRISNTTNATQPIPFIKDNDFCQKDGNWPDAKCNFTAKMQCDGNDIGFKTRYCGNTRNWDDEISRCVNKDIQNLLYNAQNLQKGYGLVTENANNLFGLLKTRSEDQIINTFPNINASVVILQSLYNASDIQNSPFHKSIVSSFTKASSNLLNDSLLNTITNMKDLNKSRDLAASYLIAVSGVVSRINTTIDQPEENVHLIICNNVDPKCSETFNVSVENPKNETIYQIKINNIPELLPQYKENNRSDFVLSVMVQNASKIIMNFPITRPRNHKIFCVYYDFNKSQWSDDGCKWGTVDKPYLCTCTHLSVFTALVSISPVELLYMDQITYIGLGFSVVSLVLCLVIEFVVWNTVVKSNISHFRHTVLVNIALSLLLAHISFLVASSPKSALNQWCFTFTVMKHFGFLAVFFWMLCMSMGLLHQMIFVFVQLRKKVYLGLCFFLGYVCPFLIVIGTVITYDNGALNSYYVNDICWLKYESMLAGSIHTFIIPAGIIVLVNMFTMVVVISRILKPNLSEGKSHDEKEIVRSVIRTVVFLTPSLGITWIFGFAVLMLDLTLEPFAQIVNYAFTILNSFQGFLLLLTGCFGEKKV